MSNKSLFVIILIGILLNGCANQLTIKENNKNLSNEKYCKSDADCISSCGSKSGFECTKSKCYNVNYLNKFYNSNKSMDFDGSIDGASCYIDCADDPFVCECINKVCTP